MRYTACSVTTELITRLVLNKYLALLTEIDVLLRGFLCFLLKTVKHIDCFRSVCHIEDAKGAVVFSPSLIEIPNGEKVAPTFSDEEMRRRLEKLRNHMTVNSVDAVALTSYHNINYFSDFVYCKFGRD